MTAPDSVPLHALAHDHLATASPDLLRAMIKTFADRELTGDPHYGKTPRRRSTPEGLANTAYTSSGDPGSLQSVIDRRPCASHRQGRHPAPWHAESRLPDRAHSLAQKTASRY
ncbi:hypothetical protein EDD91_2161 [Streptomyces sp. KS 21]|nr:hypothetical protein EDD91_2161 [Streptomyces sp. KS 21]